MGLTNVKPSPSSPLCVASQDTALPHRAGFQPVDAHHGPAPIRNGDFSRRTRRRAYLPLAFLTSPPSATKVSVPEATKEDSATGFQPRASRVPRRFFARGVVLLALSLIFSALPLFAEEEKEGGLEILHVTALCSPDWYFGARGGADASGDAIHNGKTEKQDRQRTDVGIGEWIMLTVEELKPGFKGLEADVEWEILEGDAFFGLDSSEDAIGTTTSKGEYSVRLNICVTVDIAPSQTVKIKVKTKPIVPGSDPVQKRGFTATATLDFNRKRPSGRAKSFHCWEQEGEGKVPGWPGTWSLHISAGSLIGAWSTLLVFPEPTIVNFGGEAEGGVYVLELDGNPYGTGKYAGIKIPVVTEPDPNVFGEPPIHTPVNKYGKIDSGGYFGDSIAYRQLESGSWQACHIFSFNQDQHWEWQCNWYYTSFLRALEYNQAPTGNFDNGEWVISYDERQKFTIFAFAERWDVKVEKFGSNVRRYFRGSTFNQFREHGWAPWGDSTCAPPDGYNDGPPPYSYSVAPSK